MNNRYESAQQFWCASAAMAAACFLTPRPLRALVPLGIGYLLYRVAQNGLPWADCGPTGCQWQDTEEYFPAGEHDLVDESIHESFPASDPPSYSPGTATQAH